MENYINWVAKETEHKIKLKEKDLEIVKLMNTNARIPLLELSKKLHISKVAVFNRIKNLEEKGIITGYSCFVDFFKLGFKTYQIGIKTSMTIKEKEEYLERIKDLDFMSQILKLSSSKWDFLIRIILNEEMFNDSLNELSDPNIQTMDILQVNKVIFLDRNKMQFIEAKTNSVEKLSSNEINLILELAKNSRQKIVDLSSKLKKTPKTIMAMIKKLQKKKIILSLITEFNPFVYGTEGYLFVIMTRNREVQENVVKLLVKENSTGALLNFQNPNIISFHVISNLDDLKNLEKTIQPFIDDILSHEFIKVEEQTVYNFFPKGVYENLFYKFNA